MAIVRPSTERFEILKNDLARLQKERARIALIAEGDDSPAFQTLKEIVQEKLAASEMQLDYFEKFSHDQIISILENRRVMKFFISFTVDARANIETYDRAILAKTTEIKDYKEKLSKNGINAE